jgi:predicted O-methyltransferase YrrM
MMVQIIRKIVTGGRCHKSRFHDEKGNLLDVAGFIYLPHCLVTTSLRLAFGYRPAIPWLGYRAIKHLKKLLQPDWKMLEWGSGMSTLWFAARVGNLVSIEDYKEWYDKVSLELEKRGSTNVDYRFKPDNYSSLDEFPDGTFDFILIDGSQRGNCAAAAINKIRTGGYIYLDNSDKHSSGEGGDTRIAENILLNAVREKQGEVQYFVDLLPTYLAVSQGMLVKL